MVFGRIQGRCAGPLMLAFDRRWSVAGEDAVSLGERLTSVRKPDPGTAWRARNFAAREFLGYAVCAAEAEAAYCSLEQQLGTPISDLDADVPLSQILLPGFRLTAEHDVHHFVMLALLERMKQAGGPRVSWPQSVLPQVSMRVLVAERARAVGGCTCGGA